MSSLHYKVIVGFDVDAANRAEVQEKLKQISQIAEVTDVNAHKNKKPAK